MSKGLLAAIAEALRDDNMPLSDELPLSLAPVAKAPIASLLPAPAPPPPHKVPTEPHSAADEPTAHIVTRVKLNLLWNTVRGMLDYRGAW